MITTKIMLTTDDSDTDLSIYAGVANTMSSAYLYTRAIRDIGKELDNVGAIALFHVMLVDDDFSKKGWSGSIDIIGVFGYTVDQVRNIMEELLQHKFLTYCRIDLVDGEYILNTEICDRKHFVLTEDEYIKLPVKG